MNAGAVAIVVAIIIVSFITVRGIQVDRELDKNIDAKRERALNSPTAEEMESYLENYTDALDEYGMEDGTWGWIYVNESTSMKHARNQLSNLMNRLDNIENKDRGSMDYANSMMEAKETLRGIEIDTWEYYNKRNNWYLFNPWLCIFFPTLLTILFSSPMFIWGIPLTCKILGHDKVDSSSEFYEYECKRCGERL